jgi:integrase
VKLDEDREIQPFASWDEREAISDELLPVYRAIPIFLVGTGMRPEEALALEWKDIDKQNAVASVERVHSQGRTKPCKKSDRQRRRVPLRARVLEALDQHPRRLDSRLVFPATDGGYLKQGHGGRGIGIRLCGPPGSGTAARTRVVTRSRPGRSPQGCSCSISAGSWARP